MVMFDPQSCETIKKYGITNSSQLFSREAMKNKELSALRRRYINRLEPGDMASLLLKLH